MLPWWIGLNAEEDEDEKAEEKCRPRDDVKVGHFLSLSAVREERQHLLFRIYRSLKEVSPANTSLSVSQRYGLQSISTRRHFNLLLPFIYQLSCSIFWHWGTIREPICLACRRQSTLCVCAFQCRNDFPRLQHLLTLALTRHWIIFHHRVLHHFTPCHIIATFTILILVSTQVLLLLLLLLAGPTQHFF